MGGAAFDPLGPCTPTLIKILFSFLTFIRKSIKNKEFTVIRDTEKNFYRSVIASFSGFGTIWSQPAAPWLKTLGITLEIFFFKSKKFQVFIVIYILLSLKLIAIKVLGGVNLY